MVFKKDTLQINLLQYPAGSEQASLPRAATTWSSVSFQLTTVRRKQAQDIRLYSVSLAIGTRPSGADDSENHKRERRHIGATTSDHRNA